MIGGSRVLICVIKFGEYKWLYDILWMVGFLICFVENKYIDLELKLC